MIKRMVYVMAIVALLVSGCAVTDVDRTANFNALKTFSWGEVTADVNNPVYSGDLIDKNIRRTIREEFAKRGIQYSENDPDFLVNVYTQTEEKREENWSAYPSYPFYGFYGYRYFPYRMGFGFPYWGPSTGGVRTYTKGTLVVDIAEAGSREVIWRGTVSGNVDNVQALQKQIGKGVRAIMKKYPGRPGGPEDIIPPADVIGSV